MRICTVAVMVALVISLSANAADYYFKGTVDNCLDKAENWDPEMSGIAAGDVFYLRAADTSLKTLTLSGDWAPLQKGWNIGSFTFDLGKDHVLSYLSTTEALYVTGGCEFYLVSGTVYSPNTPFTSDQSLRTWKQTRTTP